MQYKEYFISQDENNRIVEDTFIIIAYIFVCLIIVGSLLWSYTIVDSIELFVSIYSLTFIIFSLIIISIIVINKDEYNKTSYMILFNSSIFVIFLSFFVGIYFAYKYFFRASVKINKEQLINYSYKY